MAMGSTSVTIDAKQFEAKLAQADVKVRANIAKGLNRIGTLGASQLRSKMPRDTSFMANNVTVEHATPANLNEVIKSGAKYTLAQDEGTKAFFPPTDALVASGWARRHNPDPANMSDESWAFLVGRAISKKGIKAKNFIKPTIEPLKAEAIALMKEAVKGIW